MLFNSYQFVGLYLPIVLIGYYLLIYLKQRRFLFIYLVCTSLVFYGAWNPIYVLLLIASVLVNFGFGRLIRAARSRERSAWLPLTAGVVFNLGLLGYYKYANFFAENYEALSGQTLDLPHIILPLAISFYTFQQIAYLIDVSRDRVERASLWRYTTFVIFFPQLIAGPIVHYKDMVPQFFGRHLGRFGLAHLSVGLTIFAIGLFKKTVIADSAALYASPVFDSAAAGNEIGFAQAWTAAICYTIQLYFDFSGYSDMAIGLARMFGIRLPLNFHSPLRAVSIIEYWRRWHMTLQQFIVAYMYQPLAVALTRRVAEMEMGKWSTFWVVTGLPTVTIFVVIGLWHGAGWTFVVFGLMHGTYLAVNEFWRTYRRKARRKDPPGVGSIAAYHGLTLLCVILANVMFRAESVGDAVAIWAGMVDVSTLGSLAALIPVSAADVIAKPLVFALLACLLIFVFPNTQQIMGRYRPAIDWDRWKHEARPLVSFQWRPTVAGALFTGTVLYLGIMAIGNRQSEFIYFNF
ncbi:MBOAT family O-acyltransferase [uncultured Rhodospira sp.]|uniref:MBOAT family O-acyltransferase n=1 Tax=uncultured Rhodospira sp. TaxID=1936189 RepID=UPI002622A720|nr:MBOAT family O-acyltransferase [uncultured Rhodospira sp.]